MKRNIVGFCLLMIGSVGSFADTDSNRYSYTSFIHKGLKVALDVSSTNISRTTTTKDEYGLDAKASEDSIYNAKTLLIGYQNIAPSRWGYSAFLERTELSNHDTDHRLYLDMLEGNATYGLSSKWYMAFGLNLSRYTSDNATLNSKIYHKVGSGIGTQFSFGLQLVKHLAIETKLIVTSHRAELEYTDGVTGEYAVVSSALRFGLSATF